MNLDFYTALYVVPTDKGYKGIVKVHGFRDNDKIEGICGQFDALPDFTGQVRDPKLFFYGRSGELTENFRTDGAKERAKALFAQKVAHVYTMKTSGMRDEVQLGKIPIEEIGLTPSQVSLARELLGYGTTVCNPKALIRAELKGQTRPVLGRMAATAQLAYPLEFWELAVQGEHYFHAKSRITRQTNDILSKAVPWRASG